VRSLNLPAFLEVGLGSALGTILEQCQPEVRGSITGRSGIDLAFIFIFGGVLLFLSLFARLLLQGAVGEQRECPVPRWGPIDPSTRTVGRVPGSSPRFLNARVESASTSVAEGLRDGHY
jgi:hypothetical protein